MLGPAGSRSPNTTTGSIVASAHPARRRPSAAHGQLNPLRAGLLVIFIAGAITLGAPLLRPADNTSAPVRDAAANAAPVLPTTANLRVRPEPSAAVVAVLPAGRAPEVIGRLADSSWLLVRTGPSEEERGWLPADRLPLPAERVQALAAFQPAEAAPTASTASPAGLPDLVVASVFLMRDGHIALEIRNDGDGPLTEARIPVLITRASGETVGVLEVGPTTLAPRGTATVVTPVIVTSTGTYTLQLDRQESIAEASRTNNGATKLLVVGGG